MEASGRRDRSNMSGRSRMRGRSGHFKSRKSGS
jgi:hypothetical protein